MNRHCDSNPAQYERNRRFGPVVLVLGREASGAKLPSDGLRLNASKSESTLVTCSDSFSASILVRQRQVMCPLHSDSVASGVTWYVTLFSSGWLIAGHAPYQGGNLRSGA